MIRKIIAYDTVYGKQLRGHRILYIELRPRVLDKRALRRTFGPKRNEITRGGGNYIMWS
jgi:hypothetical protein